MCFPFFTCACEDEDVQVGLIDGFHLNCRLLPDLPVFKNSKWDTGITKTQGETESRTKQGRKDTKEGDAKNTGTTPSNHADQAKADQTFGPWDEGWWSALRGGVNPQGQTEQCQLACRSECLSTKQGLILEVIMSPPQNSVLEWWWTYQYCLKWLLLPNLSSRDIFPLSGPFKRHFRFLFYSPLGHILWCLF